jgi:hypothetical protein
MLIAVGQTVANEFATIVAANNYKRWAMDNYLSYWRTLLSWQLLKNGLDKAHSARPGKLNTLSYLCNKALSRKMLVPETRPV